MIGHTVASPWRLCAGLLLALAVSVSSLALAQPPRIVRVGLLSAAPPPPPTAPALLRGLRALGWIEGQNLALEYRYASWQLERLPELAAELVRTNVDVIVTGG
jgi:putative ABC transport system substrate-binding protein